MQQAAHLGENTISQRAAEQPFRLFCSWFCPYAQRAWIAVEEKGLEYEYVPIEPYEPDPSKPGGYSKTPLALSEKRKLYPDFVAASPRGLVPAIEFRKQDGSVDRIHESLVCVEYVDEEFPGPSLLPQGQPALRARVRATCAFVNEQILPHFYRLLMEKETQERDDEKQLLIQGLSTFAAMMEPVGPGGGAYFLGDIFSMADIALCPWWRRFHSVAGTYRNFEIPTDGIFARLHMWGNACDSRPSVARTTVDQVRLTENYSSYADATATSTVAKTLVTST